MVRFSLNQIESNHIMAIRFGSDRSIKTKWFRNFEPFGFLFDSVKKQTKWFRNSEPFGFLFGSIQEKLLYLDNNQKIWDLYID